VKQLKNACAGIQQRIRLIAARLWDPDRHRWIIELSTGLESFVEFFSQERFCQGLEYQTPCEVYESILR